MRVLIADDGRVSRELLLRLLAQWGYEPVAAGSGEEAWELMLEPEPPCLLVVDWMMPELDGVTLCRRLRGDPRFMPLHVIMLTSRTDPQDVVEGLEAGADDYVTKPYQPKDYLGGPSRIVDIEGASAQPGPPERGPAARGSGEPAKEGI